MTPENTLHVITTLTNPMRYRTRYQLFERFVGDMLRSNNVSLTIVELCYDDRPSLSDAILDRVKEGIIETAYPGVNFVPLRCRDVIWLKESCIEVGISQLPNDWKYAAWIDADIQFMRPDFAAETMAQLNHYDVVQMFSHAVDLDPNHQMVSPHRNQLGFMYSWKNGIKSQNGRYDDLSYHSGYAWAIRRDAYENLGGLIDTAVCGAADRHMACALIGKAELSFPKGVTQGYKDPILGWQDRCDAFIHGNVGYVPGTITHNWHGSKRLRFYHDRWSILVRNSFNPATDLRMDRTQGIWQWSSTHTPRMRALRDEVRSYFSARSEDDIRVD